MTTIRFISDLHMGHENIIKFDGRPFKNSSEMDDVIIKNWNSVVAPGDLTYILGDFIWKRTPESLAKVRKLNGQKILIKGNHDRAKGLDFTKLFAKIVCYEELSMDGKKIVLSHYPIPLFNGHRWDHGFHLYGHVHTTEEYDLVKRWEKEITEVIGTVPKMYNVGANLPYMNYTPRTLEEIIEGSKNVVTRVTS